MWPVDLPTFVRLLRDWQRLPDRTVRSPKPSVTEWWADGYCRLRRVRKGPWMELHAHRLPRGAQRREDFGKISFKTWQGSDVSRPPPPPPPPDVIDWAE